MDWKLELVVLGVTDVDRAKAFYEKLGFHLDVDHQVGDAFRVVQLTPPGSSCSITFGINVGGGEPGATKGTHLVVDDIEAAHAHLEEAGVANGGIQHFEEGAMTPGPDPQRQDFGSYVFFDDPDGNSWAVQEVHHRAGA
ncbi:VOC family protein [Mumia zhuanghuii]|uniref:VOC family protein n=2 Tax=Mumia TaxID=1546255 RepID=A0ABW1QLV6_9ACTN|nr:MULTISPECIES: VOC family protein [Mumia]KAA1423379.1 VOC family protein [Mumia zhuanghuii]